MSGGRRHNDAFGREIIERDDGLMEDLRAPREITVRVRGRSHLAVLTPDLEAGGFTVEVPALPGVITEAGSVVEARRMTREAIELWTDAQQESTRAAG